MPRGAGTRSLSILRESAIMESMIEKILFTAYLMMVQTLGQGIEVRPMVVTPQLPTLVAEHEETATGVVEDAVPDYMLYQAVRDDIAQYQYGDWSYRLSLQNEIWSKDYIANCGINFTGLKIACIGDSLTEGIKVKAESMSPTAKAATPMIATMRLSFLLRVLIDQK